MGGRAARTKGHSFEREVAILLRQIDKGARRNVEETQVSGLDIKTSLPLGIQCKRFKNWHITPEAALLQAASASEPHQTPVLISKIDHKEATVTMYLYDWFDWCKRLFGIPEMMVKQEGTAGA